MPEQRLAIRAGVVLGVAMTFVDTTVVNVALDTIARGLGASVATIQWVATGYMLGLAATIPLTGWSTRRFGARRVWRTALGAFGVASLLCAAAWCAPALIAFRVLQGLAGGVLVPVGMTLLVQGAAGDASRVAGLIAVPMTLGPTIGPLLGGAIVDSLPWRCIFWVDVPIALACIALAARAPNPPGDRAAAGPLDRFGAVVVPVGLAALVFGLAETSRLRMPLDPVAAVPLAGGLLLLTAASRRALRIPRPLVDVRLFRSARFASGVGVVFLTGSAFFGGWLTIPLYLQAARGLTALQTGGFMALQGVGMALAMPFVRRFTARAGGGRVACVGCIVGLAGTVPLTMVDGGTSWAGIGAIMLVRGVALGATMMPAMAAAYSSLPADDLPQGAAAVNALHRVGAALGGALAAVAIQHALDQLAPGAHRVGDDALAGAFAVSFWWVMVPLVLALGLSALLARASAPQSSGSQRSTSRRSTSSGARSRTSDR